MKWSKYTEQQLREAIITSSSIAEALTKLKVAPYGGNYWTIKKYIKELGIDISHFGGRNWAKGRTFPERMRPISVYLNNEQAIGSYALGKRLLKEGLLQRKCYRCDLVEWQGHPVPIELEHVNGDRFDNRLENLIFLCNNCHAQTETYRGGNKESMRQKRADRVS